MDTLSLLFYVTNAIAVLISWVLAIPIMMVALRYRDNPKSICCRIYPFSLFLLGAYKLSTCFISCPTRVSRFCPRRR